MRQSATARHNISLGVFAYKRAICAAARRMSLFAWTKGVQVLAVCQNLASQVLQNEFSVLFRKPVGIELRQTRIKGRLRVNESLIEHLLVFADKQERFVSSFSRSSRGHSLRRNAQ
jgi:hypothetical protein